MVIMVMENQKQLARTSVVPAAPPLPPPPPPSPQAYNHRCKVCKKGFMCGRVLAGHMQAHGVTGDGLNADGAFDDDSVHCGGTCHSMESGGKRMHSPRINTGRDKDCRMYRKSGKEFTSLVDHGRNNYDHDKDNFNIDGADVDGEDEEDVTLAGGWSKGKRTRRTKLIRVENGPATSREDEEDEDLANWLVQLASSCGDGQAQAIREQPYIKANKTSASNLVPRRPIFVVPHTVPQLKFVSPPHVTPSSSNVPRGLFQCRACKKVFTSHQALGGHRASHKKVKGCFAARLESGRNDFPQPSATVSNNSIKVAVGAIPAAIIDRESNGVDGNAEANMINARATAVVRATSPPETATVHVDETSSSSFTVPSSDKEEKVHECSICHRVFMSGQALGGHKRCHWLTTGASDQLTAVAKLQPFVPQDHVMHAIRQQVTIGGTSDSCFDLNMPMNQYADDPAATRQAAQLNESMVSLNAPASLYTHSRAGPSNANNMHDTANGRHYDLPEATATEDEEDSTPSAKRAKISDLKDMNMAGETSQWLQVGIALPPEGNERLLKPKG